MTTYIVLLRGINVGGHRKVSMADLRELLKKLGFQKAQTYIQSGNVVVQSQTENKKEIEDSIRKGIQDHFGFDISVMVRTRSEFLENFDKNPFPQEQKKDSYFVLLSHHPEASAAEYLNTLQSQEERYELVGDCLYFYSTIGYGKSKFNMNALEKHLKVSATSRNFKTMSKLIDLSAL